MIPITIINFLSKPILKTLGDEEVAQLAYEFCIYNIPDIYLFGVNMAIMSFLNG